MTIENFVLQIHTHREFWDCDTRGSTVFSFRHTSMNILVFCNEVTSDLRIISTNQSRKCELSCDGRIGSISMNISRNTYIYTYVYVHVCIHICVNSHTYTSFRHARNRNPQVMRLSALPAADRPNFLSFGASRHTRLQHDGQNFVLVGVSRHFRSFASLCIGASRHLHSLSIINWHSQALPATSGY